MTVPNVPSIEYPYGLSFHQFTFGFQCVPERMARFRVHLFDLSEDFFHAGPVRLGFVRTAFGLLPVALLFAPTLQVGFPYHAERTYDSDGKFAHAQSDGHG